MGATARTKRPSRRKEDREARRRRVLMGALAQIEEVGVEGLSMQQLARDLDYTPGALYRYFRSKDALVAALQCDVIGALHEALQGIWKTAQEDEGWQALGPSAGALGQLEAMVVFYAMYAERSPSHYRLNSRLTSAPAQVLQDEEAIHVLMAAKGLWDEAIPMMRQAGLAADDAEATERAVLLWSSLHGVLQTKKLMRFSADGWDMKDVLRRFAQSLWRGWGATTDDIEASSRWVEDFDQRHPLEERACVELAGSG